MRLILLIVFGILALVLRGQQTSLTKSQVAEDLAVFIAALEEAHPGLYLQQSKERIDRLFGELREQYEGVPSDMRGFYKSLLKTIVELKDGHTDLYQNKQFQEAYRYFERELPFDVTIVNGAAYITRRYGDAREIPEHAEVLSINERATPEILADMFALTASDGGRVGFKAAYNEQVFSRRFAKLLDASEHYKVNVRLPTGVEATYIVASVHDSLLQNNRPEATPIKVSFFPETNTAVLTLNTFQYQVMRKEGIDFQAFLQDSFKEIKKRKVENLVIDLRENYGGDNILAIILYSYLQEGRFQAMAPNLTRLNGVLSVSPYSNYPSGKYPFWGRHKVKALDDDYYELRDGIDTQKNYDSNFIYAGPGKKPKNIGKYKFAGKVYCLTSPLTFSAAANFSTLLRRDNRATFIGEETGGASGPYCGGGSYVVTLPHSKFRLHIPTMRRSIAGLESVEKGRGVIPDYPVPVTIEAVMEGKDLALEKALELIGGQ